MVVAKVTIPSRSAPPPPGNRNLVNRNNEHQNRYAPSTNWDDSPFGSTLSLASTSSNSSTTRKKVPPPRPPPPKINSKSVTSQIGRSQSPSLLSNIFNKKPPRPSPSNSIKDKTDSGNGTPNSDTSLIDFQSPPSSPTLTTRSNSDGVSVDSFSSDGNSNSGANNVNGFSSGNTSQAESGFEDDFDFFNSVSVKSGADKLVSDPFSPPKQIYNIPTPANVSSASFYSYIKEDDSDINYLSNGKDTLPPEPPRTMPTIIIPVQNGKKSPLFKKKPTPVSNSKYRYGTSMFFKSENDVSDYSPPMPTVPPPAPPKIIIDVHEDAEPYGIALYDYCGTHDDDLAFREGERIKLLRQLDSDWFFGSLRNGCEGMFPVNYIEVKVSLKNAEKAAAPPIKFITSYQPAMVKALYTFNAETSEDLGFQEGADILVLSQINSEWLYGRCNHREGQFPANFIEYIPANLPIKVN